jgi:outer membrane receptor protein involved in Fe transport
MLMNRDEPNGNRFPDTVYMNSLDRDDTDRAVFGQLSFDITDDLELTVGARFFKPEVTVKGFFGFGIGFTEQGWSGNGENRCASQADFKDDTPCLNVDKGIKESEHIGRVNLTWSVSDDYLVYTTWSEGYRPGGINRNPFAGNYISDFLTNWEAGWKTQWQNNRLQFNGAVFLEQWDDFQVSFTGANAITQVANGPSAEVLGTELQMLWLPTDNLRLTAAAAFYDSELKDDYANFDANGNVTQILAPKGTSLPVTADFKGNVVARYSFELGNFDAHLQGAFVYEGSRGSDLDQADNAIRGDVPSNTFLDLSSGIHNESYSVELFIKNVTDEDAPLYLTSQCATGTCGIQNYGVRARPRTVGLKFSKDF